MASNEQEKQDNKSLDDIQEEFKQSSGHRPHSVQQIVAYCQQNKLPFNYKQVNKWWSIRANPENKPKRIAVNKPHVNNEENRKIILCGYIRNIQKQSLLFIPSVIVDIFLIYYNDIEYFMIVGDKIEVQKNGLLVINKSDVINTAYASSVINLAENNESIYKWKVRINYFNPEMHEVYWGKRIIRMGPKVAKIFIGIDSKWEKDKWRNDSFYQMWIDDKYLVQSAPNYSVGGDGGLFSWNRGAIARFGSYYLDSIYDKNVIELELNCKDKSIKYYHTGKEFRVAYKNIETEFKAGDCEYSFAVAFAGASVELLQFDEIKVDT